MRYLLNVSVSSTQHAAAKTSAAAAAAATTWKVRATAMTKTITMKPPVVFNGTSAKSNPSPSTLTSPVGSGTSSILPATESGPLSLSSITTATPKTTAGVKTSTITTIKKWGQQCGVTCGCVVRFELDIDGNNNDRVIRAEYTAKKILTTTIPIPTKIPKSKGSLRHQVDNSGSSDDQYNNRRIRRPVYTNRTGRLQYAPTQCPTLHTLCWKSIQYFINRPLDQLINHHEFQSSRSSRAFRDTILSTLSLHHDTAADNNNNNDSMNFAATTTSTNASMSQQFASTDLGVGSSSSSSRNITIASMSPQPSSSQCRPRMHHHYHCFDLVEDAITAVLKGYIPPPRKPSDVVKRTRFQQQQQMYTPSTKNTGSSSTSTLYEYDNYNNDQYYYYDDDDDDDADDYGKQRQQPQQLQHWGANESSEAEIASSTWQERILHPWWPFSSWTTKMRNSNSSDNNCIEDEAVDRTNRNNPSPEAVSHSMVNQQLQQQQNDAKPPYAYDSIEIQQKLALLSAADADMDRRHWTALDWMDWFEHDREIQQQKQQHSLLHASLSSDTLDKYMLHGGVMDWLTYVDAMYHDRHRQQSA